VKLTREFTVGLDPEQAWAALRDISQVASLVPGARIDEGADDDCRGSLRVTVGRTAARYDGVARVVERDEAAHRAVVHLEGKESQGHGSAVVTLTSSASPAEDGTRVSLVAEVTVTGRFSRADQGAMADTFDGLVDGFLEASTTAGLLAGTASAIAVSEARSGPSASVASASAASSESTTEQGPTAPAPEPPRRAMAPRAASTPLPSPSAPGREKEAAAAFAVLVILWWLMRRHRA
jgi:carbon monoxide dehydrogenase subunit G